MQSPKWVWQLVVLALYTLLFLFDSLPFVTLLFAFGYCIGELFTENLLALYGALGDLLECLSTLCIIFIYVKQKYWHQGDMC